MPAKLHAKNIAIVDAAREAMGEAQAPREEAPGHPERAQHEDEGSRATPAESAPSLTACGGSAQDDVVVSPRPASRIPALRSANLDPADFAHSTCFDEMCIRDSLCGPKQGPARRPAVSTLSFEGQRYLWKARML